MKDNQSGGLDHLKRYVETFVRYIWWFVPPLLLIPVLATVSSFFMLRAYESKATIWVDSQPIFIQSSNNPWASQTASQQTVESIYELLRTRRFVQDIMIEAALVDPADADYLSDSALDDIRANLQVSWYGPHVVVVEASSKEGETATSIVAATLSLFNARSIQIKKENAAVAASFYEGQVENYKAQLAQAADELRAYKEKHPAPPDPRSPRPPAEEQELNRLQRQYDVVESTYKGLVSKLDQALLARDAEMKAAPTSFKILDLPSVPTKQTTDIRRIVIIAAAGLATALGLVIVTTFVLTIIDNTIRMPEELARITDVPIIALLPFEK